MKHLSIIVVLLVLLSSCKITAPSFKNIGNWQVSKINGTQVVVSNTAYFYNPNTIEGIKLNGIDLTVQTEGRNLGKIEVSQPGMTIPKMSDFQVPISFVINVSDLIGNLNSIINIVSGKTVDVRCIGDIKVGYSFFNKSVRVDQTVPVSIKDIK